MKKHLAVLLLFLAIPALAQEPVSNDNLYAKAINAYLDEAKRKYAGIKTERNYDDIVFIKEDNDIADMLIPIQNHRVIYRTQQALFSGSQKSHSRIPVTRISSIKNEGNKLVIHLSEYWFSASRKGALYALEGGCKVEIVFDCSKQQFVIQKVSFWGV